MKQLELKRMGLETQGLKGVSCCEWLAPPPGTMVRAQSRLLLRGIDRPRSVSMSMAHITAKEHGDVHHWSCCRGCPRDLQRAGPAPHWLWL